MSVIELHARYRASHDHLSAQMVLTGDLEQMEEDNEHNDGCGQIALTVLHERLVNEPAVHDIIGGSFLLEMTVHDGESLTVIARRHGEIIGSLVNEIDTRETSRLLLRPKGGFNALIHQQREKTTALLEAVTVAALASR